MAESDSSPAPSGAVGAGSASLPLIESGNNSSRTGGKKEDGTASEWASETNARSSPHRRRRRHLIRIRIPILTCSQSVPTEGDFSPSLRSRCAPPPPAPQSPALDLFLLRSLVLFLAELYFLIARFLTTGPCRRAAEVSLSLESATPHPTDSLPVACREGLHRPPPQTTTPRFGQKRRFIITSPTLINISFWFPPQVLVQELEEHQVCLCDSRVLLQSRLYYYGIHSFTLPKFTSAPAFEKQSLCNLWQPLCNVFFFSPVFFFVPPFYFSYFLKDWIGKERSIAVVMKTW